MTAPSHVRARASTKLPALPRTTLEGLIACWRVQTLFGGLRHLPVDVYTPLWVRGLLVKVPNGYRVSYLGEQYLQALKEKTP